MFEELNPCPWCKGNVYTSKAIHQCLPRPSRNGWHVGCDQCALLFGFDVDYAGIYETEQDAIRAWNALGNTQEGKK